MLSPLELLLVGLAATGAGTVNALAGGGTLITFPALLAVGVPPMTANVTSTVALSPGYLGGILAQRRELADQRARIWRLLPAGAVGGVAGALLLLATGQKLFGGLVPWLLLVAVVLLSLQERLRAWLLRRLAAHAVHGEHWLLGWPLVALTSVYGGYFGAGMSVMVLAVLGLVVDDTLPRLNALKQVVALAVNTSAALCFLGSGEVLWSAALVMALGSLGGGAIGGRLAGRLRPGPLRAVVVGIGAVVAIIYMLR